MHKNYFLTLLYHTGKLYQRWSSNLHIFGYFPKKSCYKITNWCYYFITWNKDLPSDDKLRHTAGVLLWTYSDTNVFIPSDSTLITQKIKSSNGRLWGCQTGAKSEHPKVVQNSSFEWVVEWLLYYRPRNNPKIVKWPLFLLVSLSYDDLVITLERLNDKPQIVK